MPVLTLVAGFIITLTHIATNYRSRDKIFKLRLFLRYTLFFNIGVSGLLIFMTGIDWNGGSLLKTQQWPVAVAHLLLGLMGVGCLFQDEKFWLATISSYLIFGLGMSVIHLSNLILVGDQKNSGPILYTYLVIPLGLCALYHIIRYYQKLSVQRTTFVS